MTASLDSFKYHIIDVDLQVLPYLVGEDNIHESQVSGANVLEVEDHDNVLVVSMIQHEGNPGRLQEIHMNLVVPLICIHESQYAVA